MGLISYIFISAGLSVPQVGMLVAIYPASWGIFQLFTGPLSDKIGRKWLITGGMLLQALSLWMILIINSYGMWLLAAILLGIATAMVYPTLLSAISDVAHPKWRASSLGVYRSLRDAGYAFGALFAGILTDFLDVTWAIGLIAIFPLSAGLITAIRLNETLPNLRYFDNKSKQ